MKPRRLGPALLAVPAILAALLAVPGPGQAASAAETRATTAPTAAPTTPTAARAVTPVADPDRTSTTPAGWGWHTSVSPATMTSFINQGHRITDLEVTSASGTPTFSAAYVGNAGTYQRTWWWYYGKTGAQVSQLLKNNNARITDLEPYVVSGQVRYAVVMVRNTGSAAKAWGWYTGTTLTQIGRYARDNTMRLIDSDRFTVGGQTRFSAVFVRNTGVDRAGWWHYYGLSAAAVSSRLDANGARLTNLERNSNGTFDVIMTKGGFAGSWWYLTGRTTQQVSDFVNQVGGRIFHVDSRVVSGVRYVDVIVLDNTSAETRRIRNLVSSRMSGNWGFYVKKVNGPVVAGLNQDTVFEPASMMKIVHAVTALRDVQAGGSTLTSATSWRQHPSFPARYDTDPGYAPGTPGVANHKDVCAYDSNGTANGTTVTDQLGPVIVRYMLRYSDNRATDAITNRYGFTGLNNTIALAGMTRSKVNHRIGCGSTWAPAGAYHNKLTLADAGKIYEGVERLQLLDSTRRADLYGYLLGGPIGTGTLQTMIRQEAAAAGLTTAETDDFVSRVVTRSKGGSYGLCPDTGTCNPPTRQARTVGGLIWVPVKTRGVIVNSPYTYGRYFDTQVGCTFDQVDDGACTAYDNLASGNSTVSVEMFRAVVRQALTTW